MDSWINLNKRRVMEMSEEENSWVNYGSPHSTAQYFRDTQGIVHLKGLVKSGTINTAIFTLPAGYRPPAKHIYAVISADLLGKVTIDSAGIVLANIGSNTNVSLAGITFRAA